MPAGRISIQGFARVIDALCERLEISNPVVVGNSMGGFIGAELALAFPTRVRKLVLISAAGISAENMWREPVMAIGRLMAVGAARTGAKQLPVVNRPRLRRAALQLVIRYPEKLSVPLASELVVGAGYGRVRRRAGRRARLLVPRPAARDRDPDADRVGAQRHPDPGRRRLRVRAPDRRQRPRSRSSRTPGTSPMLERPSRFNDLLGDFIARTGAGAFRRLRDRALGGARRPARRTWPARRA